MSQASSACVELRAAEEARRRRDFLQALYGPGEGSLILSHVCSSWLQHP